MKGKLAPFFNKNPHFDVWEMNIKASRLIIRTLIKFGNMAKIIKQTKKTGSFVIGIIAYSVILRDMLINLDNLLFILLGCAFINIKNFHLVLFTLRYFISFYEINLGNILYLFMLSMYKIVIFCVYMEYIEKHAHEKRWYMDNLLREYIVA